MSRSKVYWRFWQYNNITSFFVDDLFLGVGEGDSVIIILSKKKRQYFILACENT